MFLSTKQSAKLFSLLVKTKRASVVIVSFLITCLNLTKWNLDENMNNNGNVSYSQSVTIADESFNNFKK